MVSFIVITCCSVNPFIGGYEILLLDAIAYHFILFFFLVHVNPFRVHDGLISCISLSLSRLQVSQTAGSWSRGATAVLLEITVADVEKLYTSHIHVLYHDIQVENAQELRTQKSGMMAVKIHC